MRRRLLTALIALALLLAGMVALQASPASAATLVARSNIVANGQVIGEVVLYWDGYRNFVRTNHLGPTYGVRTDTTAGVCMDQVYNCEPPGEWLQRGNFSYYAGPVYTPPSAGHCVAAWGYIVWANAAWQGWIPWGHCG